MGKMEEMEAMLKEANAEKSRLMESRVSWAAGRDPFVPRRLLHFPQGGAVILPRCSLC